MCVLNCRGLKNVAWNTQQQGMEVGSRDTGARLPMLESLLYFILAATNYSNLTDHAHLENGAANCYEVINVLICKVLKRM